MKRLSVLVMVACMSVMAVSGCYGPFKLTKRVYDWNGTLENKWGRESLFLVMNIIPVYSFTLLADALFFNLVDFWGGENPLSAGADKKTRFVSRGDQQAVMTLSEGDRRLRVDFFTGYRPAHSVIVEPGKDGRTVARDERGEIIMSAYTADDGSVLVEDAQGSLLALHPAAAR